MSGLSRRQFVVGTGGAERGPFGTIQPHSQARNARTYGVLKLKLRSRSYRWRFVPVAGRFEGHEVCGSKGAWINGIITSSTGFGINPASFHPTLGGQRDGYGAAVNAALRR